MNPAAFSSQKPTFSSQKPTFSIQAKLHVIQVSVDKNAFYSINFL